MTRPRSALALSSLVMLFALADGPAAEPDPTLAKTEHRLALPLLLAEAGRPISGAWPTPLPSPTPGPVDETERLYRIDQLLDVRIELDPEDWEALRHQARTLGNLFGSEICLSGPRVSPYTYYPADVTVDGERRENVGLRKKGLLGSVNPVQPGLKIKFDEYAPKQRLHGERRLTLNSPVADPSYVKQCLVYQLYADAGLPAPRCNFARVRVNGENLGVYIHVESINKPFIARHFPDDEGNLYEGSRSDFSPGWISTFERKTNKGDASRADVDAIGAALQLPDDQLLPALAEHLDLESFFRYWALEVLVEQWDGYANNRNNYYIYAPESDPRFHFIPWGTDLALRTNFVPVEGGPPQSVSARADLTRRLYLHPEGKRRYVETMQDLLDEVWDEALLIERIDAMVDTIRPQLPSSERSGFSAAVSGLRSRVLGRRSRVELELRRGGADWDYPPDGQPCRYKVGEVSARFSGRWASNAERWAEISLRVEGLEIPLEQGLVEGRHGMLRTWSKHPTLLIAGRLPRATSLWPRGSYFALYLMVDPARFQTAEPVPIDGDQAFAWVLRDPDTGDGYLPGLLWDGQLELDQAWRLTGQPFSGTLQSSIYVWRRMPGGDHLDLNPDPAAPSPNPRQAPILGRPYSGFLDLGLGTR